MTSVQAIACRFTTSKSDLESAQLVSVSLNEGILAIQRTLQEMDIVHTAVTTTIAQHRAILIPLHSLPDDVLLDIFQWSSSSDTEGLDSMSSSRAPWTLSHVCRHWRTVSISSPRLWTRIDIISRELETSTHYERDMMSYKLNLPVRRSAQCDLFVRVITHSHTEIFLDECFALLLPTAYRWKTLSLTAHTSTLALRLAECRFERLTKMQIKFWKPIPQLVWHVPNIRDLSLSGNQWEIVNLPWERVTSYTCDEGALRCLPQLTALEHLSLDIILFEHALKSLTSLDISFPLILPNLRSISMWQEIGNDQEIDNLSDLFLLPSLTTLTLRMRSGYWRFPSFNGSIRRLQNLTIISSQARGLRGAHSVRAPGKAVLRTFLVECTSVTALYLKMDVSEEEILHALEDECALPKLTSLRIAAPLIRYYPGFVLDVVELRCRGLNVAPLTELRIVEAESQRGRKWMRAQTVTEDIMERWNSICDKMNVLTVFENSF